MLIYGYDDTDESTKNDRTRNIYSNQSGSCIGYWNREHVFAKSLANPSLVTNQPGSGTDIHNLRSADCQMNSTRNNRLFVDGSGNSGTSGSYFFPGDEFEWQFAHDEIQYCLSGSMQLTVWSPPLFAERVDTVIEPGTLYNYPIGTRKRVKVLGDEPFRHICFCPPSPNYPFPTADDVRAMG